MYGQWLGMHRQEGTVDLVAETAAAIVSNNVDRMHSCAVELTRALTAQRHYTRSLKAVQHHIVVTAMERLSSLERQMFTASSKKYNAAAATASPATAGLCIGTEAHAGQASHVPIAVVGPMPSQVQSSQRQTRSQGSIPEWAQHCTVGEVQAEPGFAHLTKKNRKDGKIDGRYCIIAAAKSGCLFCLQRCLQAGTSIDSQTNAGWNVYDNAHYSDSDRTIEVLRYITAAGGHMSAQYAAWIVKNHSKGV